MAGFLQDPNSDQPEKGVQTAPVLDLPVAIRERAKQVYAQDVKDKNTINERYRSLPEASRPTGLTRDGRVRSEGTLLDPLNILGNREKTIQRLISSTDLQNTFDVATGRYKGLSNADRFLAGITDDDITKALVAKANNLRQQDPTYQADYATLQAAGIPVNSLTTNAEMHTQAKDIRTIKELRDSIGSMRTGPEALEHLGPDISIPRLQELKAAVERLQPDKVMDLRKDESLLQTQETTRDTARTNASANETNANANALTAQTNAITARNNALVQQAEIDFNNRKLQYDYDIANIREKNRVNEANLDRTLRKDLAVLGLEDRREDRRYDAARDERKDRQVLILQLMQGLSNLGRNIAI